MPPNPALAVPEADPAEEFPEGQAAEAGDAAGVPLTSRGAEPQPSSGPGEVLSFAGQVGPEGHVEARLVGALQVLSRPAALRVLATVTQLEEANATEVARRTGVHVATASRALKELAAAGLLAHRTDRTGTRPSERYRPLADRIEVSLALPGAEGSSGSNDATLTRLLRAWCVREAPDGRIAYDIDPRTGWVREVLVTGSDQPTDAAAEPIGEADEKTRTRRPAAFGADVDTAMDAAPHGFAAPSATRSGAVRLRIRDRVPVSALVGRFLACLPPASKARGSSRPEPVADGLPIFQVMEQAGIDESEGVELIRELMPLAGVGPAEWMQHPFHSLCGGTLARRPLAERIRVIAISPPPSLQAPAVDASAEAPPDEPRANGPRRDGDDATLARRARA